MKTIKARHKLIPAIIMLIVAAITMSTASYAWFTMSNRVEVTGINLEVVAPTNILIRNKGLGDFLSSVTVSSPAGRLNNASSFDGVSLFTVSNPIDFVDEFGNTTTGVSLTDATSTPVAGTDGYYVDFELQLVNTGGQGVIVGLDELEISTVTTSAANGEIIEAVRFAILDEDGENSTGAVFSKTPKELAVYKTAESLPSLLTTVNTNADLFTLPANGVSDASSSNPDGVLNITVRVWIEGEDPECITANAGAQFAVTFDFYVVSVTP
jgi:hypothetical protein